MKTDKIVIVGGGSAGWMSAATLIRAYPNKDISVIESPDVPSIGVGESTLGQIRRWMRFLGIEEKDFMKATDATYKLSIQFVDFYKKDAGAFHYPFGRPYKKDPDDNIVPVWHAISALNPDLPVTSMVDLLFPASGLWENNKFYENKDGRLDNFDPKESVAYHFDAIKFGQWLKENYCLPRGVKYIPKHATRIDTDENGIKELILNNEERISADLFIDCTGFRSVLLAGALEESFISYADILPNNSAWACQIPFKDKYKEMQPFTNCTAIGNGWCWNIPLWSRIGTGYNYSDRYVSDEDALEEFKDYLCSDKMVIPRTREEVESYTYRNLKTRIGIHERTFVKNVVAIGLSAGFIEPLESNGLLSVHEFMVVLIKILERGEINEFDRLWYNNEVGDLYNGFAKFVAMHYSLSLRNDTPYWTDIMNRQYAEQRGGDYMTRLMSRSSSFYATQRKFYDSAGREHIDHDGILFIMAGMHLNPISQIDISDRENAFPHYRESIQGAYESFLEQKQRWDSVVSEAPHIVDYLRKHYYL